MDVSIVILNYNTTGLLRHCLQSIYQSKTHLNFEIIVVDNNSNDDVETLLREEFPKIRVYYLPKNIGHAGGNNVGIENAIGQYILLLNTDIVFLNDYILDGLVSFMKEHPNAAAVAPKLINPDGTIQDNCRKFPSFWQPIYSRTILGKTKKGKAYLKQFLLKDIDKDKEQTVDWLQSSAMMVDRKAIQKVGPMDELFFIYFSDVDWCKRFWLNGYKIYYNPKVSMIHYFHRESAEKSGINALSNPITRIHIKDWIKYLLKHQLGVLNKKFYKKYKFIPKKYVRK